MNICCVRVEITGNTVPKASTKRYVITGGSGYIGSHTARALRLHDPDCSIWIIDRQLRPHTLKGVDLHTESCFADAMTLECIVDYQPTAVIHCAADHVVPHSVTDPDRFYLNNVVKTHSLLSVLRRIKQPPRVLFSSTAAVYGNNENVPIEETEPVAPINAYGNTKVAIENMLSDYNRAYGLDSVCFRYFNAAGAEPNDHDLGQPWGASHIIARILESYLAHELFTLYGQDYDTPDGTCIRDYVHVWDIAQAHILALDYLDRCPGHHVFNLGTAQGISNREIIQSVMEKYGAFDLMVDHRRAGDPARLVASNSRARKLLGWVPRYSDLDTIIESAYEWYHQNYCENIKESV